MICGKSLAPQETLTQVEAPIGGQYCSFSFLEWHEVGLYEMFPHEPKNYLQQQLCPPTKNKKAPSKARN